MEALALSGIPMVTALCNMYKDSVKDIDTLERLTPLVALILGTGWMAAWVLLPESVQVGMMVGAGAIGYYDVRKVALKK